MVTILLLVAIALFLRTRTGVAMRATAFDQETARAQGMNVGRVFSVAWAIGAFLAAVAGLFYSVFPAGPPGSTRPRPSSPFAPFRR